MSSNLQTIVKRICIIITLLAITLIPLANLGNPQAQADGGEGTTYSIMQPDQETLEQWIEAYNSAPLVHIEMDGFQVPSPRGSRNLLSHLDYIPGERNQAWGGNCWAWAGTGCLGIALDVQEGIHDRLSIQYLNSNYNEGGGFYWACCGGWLSDLADFYNNTGMAIPWSNTNAHWQDGNQLCWSFSSSVPADTISPTPNYPIASITEETIPTQTVNQATAIANIKSVLDQDKAVFFGFFLPNSNAWSDFQNFWSNSAENVVYDIDQFCGTPYMDGGGHAVLCVGYNDDDPGNSYWVMLNSWGTRPGRPNGLFRTNMDMNYGCKNPGMGDGDYSFYWQTLDVAFDVDQPDISVSPSIFAVTLPPDTVWSDTLTISNEGNDTLNYNIGDRETMGGASQSSETKMSAETASIVLKRPLRSKVLTPTNTGEFQAGWQDIMTDDFEGTFPGSWELFWFFTEAYWGKNDYRPRGGSYSAFCAKSGSAGVNPPANYPNDMDAWMIYGPFSLEDATDAELNFDYWLDTELDHDYLWCTASIDGNLFAGQIWSGNSSDWQSESFDLTNVFFLGDLCGQSQVWIAFIFDSDSANTAEGAFVDDVVLRQYVGDNNPPVVPSDPSPTHQATGIPINTDLNWTDGDPDPGDTVTYAVYFDTTDATTIVSNDQSATTYDPGILSNNTQYYWKIVATDNHGASTSGPVWAFTTEGHCLWLDENPKSGSVEPSDSHDISISINTTGLAYGDYSAEIIIHNNDPDEDPTTLALILYINETGDWNDWDDDSVIDNDEILDAVYCWLTDTPHNGHLLTNDDILQLVYLWLTG